MTDTNFCCLCASDEGVFLDIFTATDRQLGNRSFLKEFETCLSVKVDRNETLSSKICHRCAIELGQCNEFVEKYNRVYEATPRLRKSVLKKSCCFCLSTGQKNCLFTLAKDFRSRIDPLQKIYKCFNRQITREEAENRSICLLCRYNLDLLYDLRKLAAEANSKLHRIAESKAILASLPKTKTFVVNRKTTLICQSKIELETLSDSDSEPSAMAQKRSTSKKLRSQRSPVELKLRTCGQCHTSVEGGIDMYRLHSTGVTVCKMCWITMDPFNPSRASKRKRLSQNEANTKLCAVFLTDVLSAASSKDNGPSKVEEDEKGDPIYIVSDESSDAEEKSAVRLKKKRGRPPALKSSEESDTKSRMRLKRGLKADKGSGDSGSNKKLKSSKDEVAAATVSSRLRKSSRYQSSDSDSSKAESKQSDASDVKNDVRKKAKNSEKVSDDHSADKLSKVKLNKNDGRRKSTVKSKSEDSASSGDGGAGRKLRKVRNKVELNLKPKLTDSQKSEKNPKRPEPRTPAPNESPTTSKNPSIQSTAKNQSPKIELSPKKSKTLMLVSFPFKLKDPYRCKVCRTEYKNRVIGMKHELTHFKQVEIKIEKLNINRHFQTIDQNSTNTELPDATCSIDLSSTNEKPLQSEVPSSTSPPGTDDDQVNDPDCQVDEGDSSQRSKRSESIQQDDKTSDIDDEKEIDAVSSSNGPLEEEPAVKISDGNSEMETAENIAPELSAETNNVLSKVDACSAEADSATETNAIDENRTPAKILEEKADENNKKEKLSEELDRSIKDTEEKENHTEDKTDRGVETSLQNSATSIAKEIEKDGDLVEEIESETDIRIVDNGSLEENSSEQTEKHADGKEKIPNNVTAVNIDDLAKPTDTVTKEESKPSDESEAKKVAIDEPEVEVTSTIASENNIVERTESNGEVNSQTDGDSLKECKASGLSKKIEEELRPINTVNEILQEVIDLATAEVKKRVESEVVSVPETLENISEEIKKTAEGSVTADEILSSFEAATNRETESYKLDQLDSTTNSLKNHLEVNAADV